MERKYYLKDVICEDWNIYDCTVHQRASSFTYAKLQIDFSENIKLFKTVKLKIAVAHNQEHTFHLIVYNIKENFDFIEIVLYHSSKLMEDYRAYKIFLNKTPSEILEESFETLKVTHLDLNERLNVCFRLNETTRDFLERILYGRGVWKACSDGTTIAATEQYLLRKKKLNSDIVVKFKNHVVNTKLLIWGYDSKVPKLKFATQTISPKYKEIFSNLYKNIENGEPIAKYEERSREITYGFLTGEYLEPFMTVDEEHAQGIVYETIHRFNADLHRANFSTHNCEVFLVDSTSLPERNISTAPLLAKVVAHTDETLFADENYRVLLQFPFSDVKVPAQLAQVLAHSSFYSSFVPPLGTEVLVSWYETKPIVIASLFNYEHKQKLKTYETGIVFHSTDLKRFSSRKNEIKFHNEINKEIVHINSSGLISSKCNDYALLISGDEMSIKDEAFDATGKNTTKSCVVTIQKGDLLIFLEKGNVIIQTSDNLSLKGKNIYLDADNDIILQSKKLTLKHSTAVMEATEAIKMKSLNTLIDSTELQLKSQVFSLETTKLNINSTSLNIKNSAIFKINTKLFDFSTDVVAKVAAKILLLEAEILKADVKIGLITAVVLIRLAANIILLQPTAIALLLGMVVATAGVFRLGIPF